VLELLQSRQMISGRELSERLEVDQRTVRRYIVMLQDMGIPIEGTRGRYGTYRLRPGFRLPPLMLRDDEVMAVTLGLMVARKMGLSLATPAAESALAKIERVLPAALREQTQALQSSLSVEVMQLPDVLPGAEIVVTLSSASARNRRVWLRYRSYRDAETEREFDPYGLVYRMGYWYTVGYCHLRSELRTLRLDRIVSVEEREQSFQPPANFDCLDFVVHSIQQTPGAWYVEVLVETSYEDAQRYFPPAMAVLEECSDGILMRCYVEQLSWVAHLLVSLRCPFIVRQPVELKAEIRKAVQHVLEQIERS
jgi:predicted DNA-binding transcriptional regulator YafY